MAESNPGTASKDEAAFKKKLDAEREDTLQHLLKVTEKAYRRKLITMEAGPEEIVYTIRIPHERSGAGLELFAVANTVMI